MNTNVLKAAEKEFLKEYPGGFRHASMVEIGKKHKMVQLETFAKEQFSKKSFGDTNEIIAAAAKLVSRSTMISMFEKPKFRDMVKGLPKRDKESLAKALYELLHGKEKQGFEQLVDELKKERLAKWPLATVIQSYYRPNKEVFVKPTTAKLVIEKVGLDLKYDATPSWDFYRQYRKSINEMKGKVSKSLAPNNPAFCGFLMMSL